MAIALVVALAAFVLCLVYRRPGRPTELDADVWVADSVERAARLAAKTAAWKDGRTDGLATGAPLARGPIVLADPNAALRRRESRPNAMLPPRRS